MRKLWRLPRQLWGQVRWQVAACYVLPGIVSVLLVAVFGLLTLNMLIRRASINLVERQVDLQVEIAAASVNSIVSAFTAGQRGEVEPQWGELLASITTHGIPGSTAYIRCEAADGSVATYSYPVGLPTTIPDWLSGDSFRGVVFEDRQVAIHAWARKESPACTAEALLHVPLDRSVAEMISTASGVEVSVPGPRPNAAGKRRGQGPPWSRDGGSGPGRGAAREGAQGPGGAGGRGVGRRDPPPESRLLLEHFPVFGGLGTRDYLPVVVPAHNWETGALEDKVAFRVRPNQSAIYSQMAQYGQSRALWVYVLPLLAVAFLAVELLALWIAVRLARRISSAIDGLTASAAEISNGNLAYRVPPSRDDQLGQLAESFNHMADSLEHLVAEEKEKERLQRELVIARQVQEGLFPLRMPDLRGVQLAASCQPARVVSGDLYDVIPLGESRVGLLCADVSGKGISASLIVSSLQALIRAGIRCHSATAESGSLSPGPAALIQRINAELSDRLPDNRFITLFWAEYDLDSQVLRYTNAGHNAPLLWLPGSEEPVRLEAGGIPVGMFGGATFEEEEISLPPGAMLAVYTDGITDAINPMGEEFGDERFAEFCRRNTDQPAEKFLAESLELLRQFAGDAEQFDDMTMIVLRTAARHPGRPGGERSREPQEAVDMPQG